MSKEIWKDIKEYKGRYQISTLGKVKSVTRNISDSIDRNYLLTGRILKTSNDGHNYRCICLDNKKNRKTYKIHRLVAQAFIDNPEKKKEVNHKNGIKNDNRVINLEWCSRSENIQHAMQIGLKNDKGENNSKAKLTEREAVMIKLIYKTNLYSTRKLGKIFNISSSIIWGIINSKRWKHI